MTDPDADRTREEQISALAHEIWEKEGRPAGRDKDHWARAQELVDGKSGTGQAETGQASEDASGANTDHGFVRPAGRTEMDMPPSRWSKTDEEIDESFPASDPPGNY